MVRKKLAHFGAVFALLMGLSTSAFAAACTSTFNLGTLDPGDAADYWRAFFSPQSNVDCYTFGLSSGADVEGSVAPWDLSFRLNISIVSVTGGGSLVDTDASLLGFAFDNLSAGTYQVTVESVVSDTGSNWPSFGVGYGVGVNALASSNAVPEPNGLALLGIALLYLAAFRRRMAGKPTPPMTFNGLRTG